MNIEEKLKFIVFVPCFTASLSVIGSFLTLLTVHRTRILGTKLTTYHHLLVSVSVFDLVMSLAAAFGPLPIPSETGFHGAHGNFTSCTFQAFMLQLGSASFGYSAMLMVYYVLLIRFNLTETIMKKRVEPFLQFIPGGFSISTAIAGLFLGVYNPQGAGTLCWVADYPTGCSYDPELDCERGGDHVELFGLWLLTVPTVIWTIVLVLCSLAVALTVLHRFRSSGKFVFSGSTANARQAKQTRSVIVQCAFYGLSFINVLIWSTIITFLELLGVELDLIGKDFWLLGMAVFFFPLQGFFNFLIFIRPRYLSLRSQYGCCSAFWEALWNPRTQTRSSKFSSKVSQKHKHLHLSRASDQTTGGSTIISHRLPSKVETHKDGRSGSGQPLRAMAGDDQRIEIVSNDGHQMGEVSNGDQMEGVSNDGDSRQATIDGQSFHMMPLERNNGQQEGGDNVI